MGDAEVLSFDDQDKGHEQKQGSWKVEPFGA